MAGWIPRPPQRKIDISKMHCIFDMSFPGRRGRDAAPHPTGMDSRWESGVKETGRGRRWKGRDQGAGDGGPAAPDPQVGRARGCFPLRPVRMREALYHSE